MYLKSPYPDVPPLPNVNAHYFFFKRPIHADWPNFTAHINVETGEKVMYYDFVERIRDLATGLGASVSQGGLGIVMEGKERVGIMGENSSVSLTGFLVCRMIYLIRFISRSTSPWCMLVSDWPHPSFQFHPIQLLSS